MIVYAKEGRDRKCTCNFNCTQLSVYVWVMNQMCLYSVKCDQSVDHVKRGLSHNSTIKCRYLHELDNRMFLCQVS